MTTFTAPAAEKESGIVIYTTLDHGSDETAFAVPFTKAERFALVTNVTTPDGKSLRVTNNQMKELVYPPDLTKATAVDAAGIAVLRQKLEEFQALQKRFPRTHIQLTPIINELGRVVRLLEEGNVLITGRLLSKDEYETHASANRAKTVDLTVNEVFYKGAKLTAVSGEKISIMHSGGVASVTIGQLSDDQIELLNATSSSLRVDREKAMASTKPSSAPEQDKAAAPAPTRNETFAQNPPNPAGFFTVTLEEKFAAIDSEFAIKIADLEGEVKNAEAALPEGVTYSQLLEKLGKKTEFLVKRKLDAEEFGYYDHRPDTEFDLYEIVINPRFNPELALLETTITTFTSGGTASMRLKKLPPVQVKMEDGFDRDVEVFRELPEMDDEMVLLEPFHKLQRLQDKLKDEQKTVSLIKEAVEGAEIEMRESVFPPRVHLSESLKRLGFSIQVGKISLPKDLDYDSTLQDLSRRDYDKLFMKYSSDSKSVGVYKTSYADMIRRITDTKVAIAIVAPGFRASKDKGLGNGSSGTDSSTTAPKFVVKMVTLTRNSTGFGRATGLRPLGLSYTVKRQGNFDLHPDGNGLVVTVEPFESEVFFFQAIENVWVDESWKERDIESVVKRWEEEFAEKVKNLSSRVDLGQLSEEAVEREYDLLGDEFRQRLLRALGSY